MALKLALSVVAALLFALGGMLMKPSEGLTRLWPTVGVFTLFALGAALNIVLVRVGEEVGPAYLAVAGAETVVALLLAAAFYGERLGALRLGAAALIVVGVVILASEGGGGGAEPEPEPTTVAAPAQPVGAGSR